MRGWTKWLFALAAPLTLTGCLWGPGQFTADLALDRDGRFTLDYKGEILLQTARPPEVKAVWDPSKARCYKDDRTEIVENVTGDPPEDVRQCTAAEVAKLKADFETQAAERVKREKEQAEQMAKVFGLPGSDDESNRAFAEKLKKYAGWRSVAYRGKGVFDVDYHAEGVLTQDYLFPAMPDSDLILPFIAIRRRADGSVQVNAPALTGGAGPFGARAAAMGMPDADKDGPVSMARGRLTIITDGEILTNNSEDGPSAPAGGKRRLTWDVGPGSKTIPEALVRL